MRRCRHAAASCGAGLGWVMKVPQALDTDLAGLACSAETARTWPSNRYDSGTFSWTDRGGPMRAKDSREREAHRRSLRIAAHAIDSVC